ncbi:glycoside hydrolase family 30 beta sandwich domain-containing protein [Fastidiosipila sanguinis]|uniref:glycoside hydrolase family 30 beta sandwich domain-containing protein n=1 Tax=Fastidiosipila sanguinis TaxID=236753 RepID=UPI00241E18B7|nr:glycoside hydrolase family 30 beta sandwich domain-containing protein [Fastidiosipila sanguinis]
MESGATVLGSSSYSKDLEQLALMNPNGEIILIVLNQADNDHDIVVRVKGNENFSTIIECNSITTFVIK